MTTAIHVGLGLFQGEKSCQAALKEQRDREDGDTLEDEEPPAWSLDEAREPQTSPLWRLLTVDDVQVQVVEGQDDVPVAREKSAPPLRLSDGNRETHAALKAHNTPILAVNPGEGVG